MDIIVVGGGLGGFAAAAFLRKRHTVTVLERGEAEDPLHYAGPDYGMSIVSNAMKLLIDNHLNLEALECSDFTHTWIQKADNTLIKEQLFDTKVRFGTSSVFTRRSRLHAELARMATSTSSEFEGEPAEIIGSAKVVKVFPEEGRVVLEDGREFKGDVIVGADGINSFVRDFILENGGVANSGLATYMSFFDREVISSDPELSKMTAPGVAGLGVWFGGPPDNLRVSCFPIDDKGRFQLIGGVSEEIWKDQFDRERASLIKGVDPSIAIETFEKGSFHPSVVKLFTKSLSGTHDVWRVRDIEPLERWTKGKTVIVADAAHAATPHIGQGCNLAIEDAEALAFLLRDVRKGDSAALDDAFSTFFNLRQPRTDFVQRNSRAAGVQFRAEKVEGAPTFDPAEFSKIVYSYTGAEAALEQQKTEKK